MAIRKTQFVNAMRAGDAVEDVFALAEKTRMHKKDGDAYLNVTLSDKTGRIKGVVWDNVESILSGISACDFVNVTGRVSDYRGKLQLVLKAMSPHPTDGIDTADFLPTTPRNIDAMFQRLQQLTDSVKTDHLNVLLEAFWNDAAFVEQFKAAPAAMKMHHAYIGGLLEHSLSMALLVESIAGHYGGLDRDLLLTGAVLHDIGKIQEFEYQYRIAYSTQGKLMNHIVIGLKVLDEKISQLDGAADDDYLLLRHMVVSHHGSREFGSPEPPKT
ncbi:MAG: HD domain-containing protein, partial [Desulfobacterales bacterium]